MAQKKKTPASAEPTEIFDLESFTQRSVARIELTIPGSNRPLPTADGTPAWIETYGYLTEEYEAFIRKVRADRLDKIRRGEIDEDDEIEKFEVQAQTAMALTCNWHISFGGKYLDLTEENKRKVFLDKSRRFVTDQVYQGLHTQGNFIDASAIS